MKSITEANDIVDIYLNRGLDWDAYAVSQEDDPGYIPEEGESDMMSEKNLEMVEAVVPTTIADEVLKAFEARPAAMDPQMVHKEENLEAIVAGFKNRHTLQKFVGELENLFPKQISWR